VDASPATDLSAGGFVTVQLVVAAACSLLVFVGLAQLILVQYVRGVVQAAVDEGARSGAPVDAGPDDCRDRAGSLLRDLLGRAVRDGVSLRCTERDGLVVASATLDLDVGLPALVPAWHLQLEGTAVREREP
jgi:hypothetical protein